MRPGSGQPRRLIGSDWAGHYGSEHLLFLNGSTLMAQTIRSQERARSRTPRRCSPTRSARRASPTLRSRCRPTACSPIRPDCRRKTSCDGWIARVAPDEALVEPGDYVDFSLSPDESQLAFSRVDPQSQAPDIWILDLARGTSSRLTSERLVDASPTWSPDAQHLAFRSNRSSSIGVEMYETAITPGAPSRLVLGMQDHAVEAIAEQPDPVRMAEGWTRLVLPGQRRVGLRDLDDADRSAASAAGH